MPENALMKSPFMKKYGPRLVGFNFLSGQTNTSKNDRLWTNIDGTQRPLNLDGTLTLTTTRQLLAKESGSKVILNSATSFTTTLPLVAEGLEFRFFVKLVGASTGHTILAHATDVTANVKMYGKVSPSGAAAAATNGKGRINTNATATVGDGMRVWSDGTSWYADPIGVWAETA